MSDKKFMMRTRKFAPRCMLVGVFVTLYGFCWKPVLKSFW